MKGFQVSESNTARRPSFKPLLEDALQVLKNPLHNPDAKGFKKIVSVMMKNCCFFRENFSSQVALDEFVELAKFYVGYEVCSYGAILLHEKEYVEKLRIILDGRVEKVVQKPSGKQIQGRKRVWSFDGFELSPLKIKARLPSLKEEIAFPSARRLSAPKIDSISDQLNKISRPPSQQREPHISTLEDEIDAESHRAFQELMRHIAGKRPEMKKKYYVEEILRADRIKSLTTGDYFGEGFCGPNRSRSNSLYAVSSPEIHLLTLEREDYDAIMRELQMRKNKKQEAFLKLFSSFEKEHVRKFSEYFCQKSFQTDEVIYFQGAPSQDLYIVQSGEVQFFRKPTNSKSSFMPIVSIVRNHVFGEEPLLSMDCRQESVVAKVPNTTVFTLKASLFFELRKEFDDLFVQLRKGAEEKFQWRQKKTNELFERAERELGSPSDPSAQGSNSPGKGLFSPRHSIQIPYHRSFISERSPTNSPNSLASVLTTIKPRKLSNGELSEQNKKNEIYKAQFTRALVISDVGQTTRVGKKANYFQACDISPGLDLKNMNFRKELYGRKSSLKSLERPGKAVTPSQLRKDTQQKLQIITCDKHAENERPWKLIRRKSDI